MKNHIASFNLLSNTIVMVVLFLHSPMAAADTFKEGGDAYKKRDYATAIEKFNEVAEKGDHRAMYALGSIYAGGAGIKQDYKQAYKWFSKAAKYGRLDAQYKIGLMYELGVGVKQNYRLAARSYQKVAKQGYAHGQFKFGQLYLNGKGVKQDIVKAYAWMVVARQNFINAMPKGGKTGNNENKNFPTDELQSNDVFATIHLDLINNELGEIESKLTPKQLQASNKLAQEYIQYR